MTKSRFLNFLGSQEAKQLFLPLYGAAKIDSACQRYRRLVEKFSDADGALRVFSVPGRTELCGNHTDHNRGKVLAASIQLDVIAAVTIRTDNQVFLSSAGFPDVCMDISDLSMHENEKGKVEALVRGIAAEFAVKTREAGQGALIKGFNANIDSLVMIGSGLSSSAAFEVLIAKIFDNLFCGGKRSALELAQIGQKAENIYFGKPCGLMDQIACATGGAVAIDFKDSQDPIVKRIGFDPESLGYALYILDTKGSHADLTADYAAIPIEMKKVAAFFGKDVLREADEKIFFSHISDLRKAAGDRAVLRAMHFFNENQRVNAAQEALEALNANPANHLAMSVFLDQVNQSGNSSWQLLQNIYSVKNINAQDISIALAITKNFLSAGPARKDRHTGACRVHGGGFAGTIQVYLPLERLEEYRTLMEGIFGEGALTVLKVRQAGAVELK